MPFNDYLAHHGILGQKWGVRRYQNPDGSLTSAGRERYGGATFISRRNAQARLNELSDKKSYYQSQIKKRKLAVAKAKTNLDYSKKSKNSGNIDRKQNKFKSAQASLTQANKIVQASSKEINSIISALKKNKVDTIKSTGISNAKYTKMGRKYGSLFSYRIADYYRVRKRK